MLALAQADEIQNLGRIRERILNLPGQVRVAVLTNCYVIDIGNLCANEVEASFDRKRGKTRVVLNAVQALFSNGENDLAVLHDCSRGVGVKHIQSQDQH